MAKELSMTPPMLEEMDYMEVKFHSEELAMYFEKKKNASKRKGK